MQKRIRELKDHFIVCGLGATGRYAVEELQKTGTPYIVVEINEDNVKRFQEHDNGQYREILYVVGDATEEKVLNEAGLDRAACVLAAVGGDKDNLVITVMVRQSNEAVRIIARCADLKYADRMTKAGANSTVSPNHIGGLRLASEALRPHVTSFLDLMLREKTRTLRIDEIAIGENSVWSGRTLAQVDLKANYNLMPLAVKSSLAAGHNDFLVNPPENLELRAGAVVIVMGDVEEVQRARRDAHHHDAAAAAGH
jgi:voltage-gated potassium channel